MRLKRISTAWRIIVVLAAVPVLCTLALGCASTGEKKPACDPRRTYCPNTSAVEPDAPLSVIEAAGDTAAKYGLEIVSVRLTAAGHLLDLRYRVKDAEKASPIFDRSNKAYLIDNASGARLSVPRMAKVGPLRQTNFNPDPNRVYFILFSNSGGIMQSGSLVTLEVGECTIPNLAVQ